VVPHGFSFRLAASDQWLPHPVPGIRMRVLSVNRNNGYATLLLDVAPGTRFPAHHHAGAEECYVISGDVNTLGRRMGPGDFLHADHGTDHGGTVSVCLADPDGNGIELYYDRPRSEWTDASKAFDHRRGQPHGSGREVRRFPQREPSRQRLTHPHQLRSAPWSSRPRCRPRSAAAALPPEHTAARCA